MYYPDRAARDAGLLTVTGAPLETALRITGTPVLSLHLSSTHPDGALHVYLEDVSCQRLWWTLITDSDHDHEWAVIKVAVGDQCATVK